MPYKVGDKFIIELDSKMTNKYGVLYAIKGVHTIFIFEEDLDTLEKVNSDNARSSVPIDCIPTQ